MQHGFDVFRTRGMACMDDGSIAGAFKPPSPDSPSLTKTTSTELGQAVATCLNRNRVAFNGLPEGTTGDDYGSSRRSQTDARKRNVCASRNRLLANLHHTAFVRCGLSRSRLAGQSTKQPPTMDCQLRPSMGSCSLHPRFYSLAHGSSPLSMLESTGEPRFSIHSSSSRSQLQIYPDPMPLLRFGTCSTRCTYVLALQSRKRTNELAVSSALSLPHTRIRAAAG